MIDVAATAPLKEPRYFHVWAVAAFVLIWTISFQTAEIFEVQRGVSFWYLPAGLRFAFLLGFGWRYAPLALIVGLAFGALIWLPDQPIGWLWTPLLPTAFAVIAAEVLRRRFGSPFPILGQRHVFAFLITSIVMTGTCAAANVGLGGLFGVWPRDDLAELIVRFWVGDLVGAVVFTPVLLLAIRAVREGGKHRLPDGSALLASCLAATAAVTVLLTTITQTAPLSTAAAVLLVIPIILVATRGSIALSAVMILAANLSVTILGRSGVIGSSGFDLQVLSLGLSASGLMLAAVVADRNRASRALHQANAALEQTVAARTAALADEVEERKLAQAERDAAHRATAHLYAAASHDLKQPLLTLDLALARLEEGRSETRETAQTARVALRHVRELASSLLLFSKAETRALSPLLEEVALGDVLGPLMEEFSILAEAKDIELRYVETTARVTTDRLLLERIVRNLVMNAVEHSHGREALVGCRRKNGGLEIWVCDDGDGMDQAAAGSGLGLQVARQFAVIIGAKLVIASQRERGTAAKLCIPSAI